MDAIEHAAQEPQPSETRSPTLAAILRAILGELFRPGRAGPTLASARAWKLVAGHLILITLAMVSVGLVLRYGSVLQQWVHARDGTLGRDGPLVVQESAEYQAAADRRRLLAMLVAGAMSIVGWIGVTGLLALLAWPAIHRFGRVGPSVRLCLAAATGSAGLLATAALAAALISLGLSLVRSYIYFFVDPFYMLLALIGIAFLMRHQSVVIRGLQHVPAEPVLPPRCENCGYDLTSRSESDICPECGTAAAESLAADRREPLAWEVAPRGIGAAVRTAAGLIFRPVSHYSRMRAQWSPDAARQFTRLHVGWMSVVSIAWATGGLLLLLVLNRLGPQPEMARMIEPAMMWVLGLSGIGLATGVLMGRPTPPGGRAMVFVIMGLMILFTGLRLEHWGEREVGLFLLPMMATAAPLLVWSLNRGIWTLMSLIWTARGSLPDLRWMERVAAYEVSFGWVMCTAMAAWVTTYFLWDDWISRAADQLGLSWFRFGLGPPLEIWVVLLTMAASVLIWFARYEAAMRSMRYANR